MKLARLASTPASSVSVSFNWLVAASSVNSTDRRDEIARPTRAPKSPLLPHVAPCCLSTGSSGVMRPGAPNGPENDALMAFMSVAPSPKYHDEARRLGFNEDVTNEGPAGGRLPVPSVGLLPNAPP